MKTLATIFVAVLGLLVFPVQAERLKDLASIRGVRDNQLIGYGLMVGLDGTGDQTMQTPFTTQSLTNMLSQLGITTPPGASMQLKNVAAVMVTALLPAYARPGQNLDITVSSLGNAKSLKGGTLLLTPLKGANGNVYALAQGNMVVGGAGASANGSQVKINQLTSGRIPSGAIVERAVVTAISGDGAMMLELNTTDFGTAQKAADAINREIGPGTALALDGRVIQVKPPANPDERVGYLARLENIDVTPSLGMAKVVINARTGSIVMNQIVRINDCAVAHGNLTVVINTDIVASQPGPLSGGTTLITKNSTIDLTQSGGALQVVKGTTSLADVVKSLNGLGANPQDLVSILQSMKAVGALRAELEII